MVHGLHLYGKINLIFYILYNNYTNYCGLIQSTCYSVATAGAPGDIHLQFHHSRQRRSGFLALVDVLSQKISDITPSRTSKNKRYY